MKKDYGRLLVILGMITGGFVVRGCVGTLITNRKKQIGKYVNRRNLEDFRSLNVFSWQLGNEFAEEW